MNRLNIKSGSYWKNSKKEIPKDKSNIINDLSKGEIYCTVCKERLKIPSGSIDRETIIKFKNKHKKCNKTY